jgi:hypothetical protein
MDGYGETTTQDGKKHFGYYKSNKKNGFGIVYWPKENKIFLGFWVDGKQESIGKYILELKQPKYGQWKNGVRAHIIKKEEEAIHLLKKDYPEYEKLFRLSHSTLKHFIDN